MKKVKILNVQFDACTMHEALSRSVKLLTERSNESGKYIVTPNPEMLLEAQRNAEFRDVLNNAWLSIPDGIGILWAATFKEITKRSGIFMKLLKGGASLACLALYPQFCRRVLKERVTGVDLMEALCDVSRRLKLSIFLLGSQPGVAEKVKIILEKKYPGVLIKGIFSGSPEEYDFAAIQARISELQPQLLFVAYGSPSQELWIAHHLHQFKSVKIAMGVGGAFDFIAGVRHRAPKWMQKLSIEWLYRLLQEPKRIKRIWNAAVKFPIKIISS